MALFIDASNINNSVRDGKCKMAEKKKREGGRIDKEILAPKRRHQGKRVCFFNNCVMLGVDETRGGGKQRQSVYTFVHVGCLLPWTDSLPKLQLVDACMGPI